jgi:hypothetical protein
MVLSCGTCLACLRWQRGCQAAAGQSLAGEAIVDVTVDDPQLSASRGV